MTADSDEMHNLAGLAIDIGLGIHRELGPGLFESVYEAILMHRLQKSGVDVQKQKSIAIIVDGITFPDAFRADLFLNHKLLIELKSTEKISGLHIRQTLTYVRLLNAPFGLILNFGGMTFREGVKRVINNHVR